MGRTGEHRSPTAAAPITTPTEREHDMTTTTAPSDILTETDVVAMTGLARGTCAYYRHCGQGPRWFKLGRSVRYRRADVQEWLDQQYAATGSQR